MQASGRNPDTRAEHHPMNALMAGNHKPEHEPFGLFARWMEEARAGEINDPEAMCLASVDKNGLPNARMVLLRGFDERGFVFYTNRESAKGGELEAHPMAAGVLHWKSLRKQFRFRGPVEQVSEAESDAYFAGRPATAASAPGPARSRGRWRADSPWKRRWRRRPRDSASAMSRAPRIGAATAFDPSKSSSGPTSRSACTSGCAIAARSRKANGPARRSIHERVAPSLS